MRRFCFGLFSSLAFVVSRARLIISVTLQEILAKKFVCKIRTFSTELYKLKGIAKRDITKGFLSNDRNKK